MKKIRGIMAIAGFLLVLGTFGAYDQDRISLVQFGIQFGIGLILIAQTVIGRRAR